MVVHDPDLPVEVEHLVPGPPDYSNRKCFCEHPYHGDVVCGAIESDGHPCDCRNSIPI
jgi:hypothetical protein